MNRYFLILLCPFLKNFKSFVLFVHIKASPLRADEKEMYKKLKRLEPRRFVGLSGMRAESRRGLTRSRSNDNNRYYL